jgi:hypothetical protein
MAPAGCSPAIPEQQAMAEAPQPLTPLPPSRPPFDRERFVFKTLAVVISPQLLVYGLAAGICGQRSMAGHAVGQVCPGTLQQLQGGFDSTLNLLLALLGERPFQGWCRHRERERSSGFTAWAAAPAKQSAGCCRCSPP